MDTPSVPKDPVKSGAVERIIGALRKNEGFRHLWLGGTGMGKTVANRTIIEYIRKQKLVDITLTVDDKDRWKPQYQGMYRKNPEHLQTEMRKAGEDASHIVFRGAAFEGNIADDIEHESVSSLAWDLVRLRPARVLVNVDELADATNGHQAWNGQTLPALYRKGRGVGISVLASTQLPQQLPRDAFGLSDTIGIFRITAREAKYLADYRVIGHEDIERVSKLEVGQWILYDKASPDDGSVYRF